MNNSQLINQTSGKQNWWTPIEIIEAARHAMGSITLDPASSAEANRRVKAECYFSSSDDGLTKKWFGNVWLNHPFGRQHNSKWINKLIYEIDSGNVKQACCITYACTSELWFQPLFNFPMCFLTPRTDYWDPESAKIGRGATKGSVVTGLNIILPRFVDAFNDLGAIMIRKL